MVVHAEDIPFTTFIDVPGALPGMTCQIRGDVEHVSWHLLDPTAAGEGRDFRVTDPGTDPGEVTTFCRLAQKTVIQLSVAVSEDQQIHVRSVPLQAALGVPLVN